MQKHVVGMVPHDYDISSPTTKSLVYHHSVSHYKNIKIMAKIYPYYMSRCDITLFEKKKLCLPAGWVKLNVGMALWLTTNLEPEVE